MITVKKMVIRLMALMLCVSSCSILDIDIPDNLVKDDYWKTKDQLDAALMGVYSQMNGCIPTMLQWGDVRSDIYTRGADTPDNDIQLLIQDLKPSNGVTSWSAFYKVINNANSFIQNAPLVLDFDPSVTDENVKAMLAEAYGIRALFYFYLVRTFKEVPVSLLPYESDTQAIYSKAESEDVVLDQIESDLKFAYEHASNSHNGGPEQQYGRVTKNAIRALWADVKLWRKDYDGCIALCEELDGEYSGKLLKSTEWFTNFINGNTSESIFEYQYLPSMGPASPFFDKFRNGSTNHFLINMKAYGESLSSLFPSVSEDHPYGDTIRTVLATLLPSGSTLGEVYKYVGAEAYKIQYRTGQEERTINFIFYRYREVILMKAEALGMLGRYGEAVAAINQIREATRITVIKDVDEYGTGVRFLSNVLKERIAELAFEGKQWFSMVRMARNYGNKDNAHHDLLIDRIALTTYSNIKVQTMRARLLDPESWFLPYNTTEVDKNPLLDQKPYYEGK